MDTKVIPLSELRADPEGVLNRCLSEQETIIIELGDRGSVSIQPLSGVRDDLIDELIEHDPSFRDLLAQSLASPLEPFDTVSPKDTPCSTEDETK
jgi:hypothetical protein